MIWPFVTYLLHLLQQIPPPATEEVSQILSWGLAVTGSAIATLFWALNKSKDAQIEDLRSQRNALQTLAEKRTDQLYDLSNQIHTTMKDLQELVKDSIPR